MENRIDAALNSATRDQILDLIAQIRALLPFLIDLSPEERQSLLKMGNRGRPFVEQALNLVEQDDSFMPRSFNKTEMRKDKDLDTMMQPVVIQMTQLFEAVNDTMMLVGSNLILAGLDVYRNAKDNGKGANLDNLVPLLGQRFKRKPKKDGGNNTPPA
jgi:hypothetical protein